jgi:hypothetical protein
MLRILGFVSVLALGALSFAVSVAAHAGKGPHGGPVADAGKYYVEVVTADNKLQVYIFDDASGDPVSVKGAQGTAIMLVGEQKETVQLAPADGENELAGKPATPAGAGARVVILIQLAGQPSIVGRLLL